MGCEFCGSRATGPCDLGLYEEVCRVCCEECNYCGKWDEVWELPEEEEEE